MTRPTRILGYSIRDPDGWFSRTPEFSAAGQAAAAEEVRSLNLELELEAEAGAFGLVALFANGAADLAA